MRIGGWLPKGVLTMEVNDMGGPVPGNWGRLTQCGLSASAIARFTGPIGVGCRDRYGPARSERQGD